MESPGNPGSLRADEAPRRGNSGPEYLEGYGGLGLS